MGIYLSSIAIPVGYLPAVAQAGHSQIMNNVANLRKSRNLTQGALAELADVKQPHISRLENGDEGVTLGVMLRVAGAMKVPVWELFADDRTEAERLLLDVFRQLPHARQAGWLDMAKAVLDQQPQDQENAQTAGQS
jgi:transcriptional regulator with XRE-family HTH domain